MKTRTFVFFQALAAIIFMHSAYPADAGADAEARVKALQEELSAAKGKVTQLEADLAEAQKTIRQLQDQNAAVATNSAPPAAGAKAQTVRGQPLYDAYNPQTPVAQEDVIAEKFTPDLQD